MPDIGIHARQCNSHRLSVPVIGAGREEPGRSLSIAPACLDTFKLTCSLAWVGPDPCRTAAGGTALGRPVLPSGEDRGPPILPSRLHRASQSPPQGA